MSLLAFGFFFLIPGLGVFGYIKCDSDEQLPSRIFVYFSAFIVHEPTGIQDITPRLLLQGC